ncbi:F-box/FBD/LRR-repeat protein At1g13570-like [Gastrolobium bilobum]|uniref:F-box/FBD/LRR-repeat protein At1g13570-like n=1 Tax=Gastrolobium bilobum TaxID=150636 RepID=UPI002AB08045|nr:F-box/FBD/LRR-repeat protein At1g13570-like [Gastrolobium bilobum]
MEPDRISYLPDRVMDQILSYVPNREAVGTSILSRKWRYKWATVPNLVFDNDTLLYYTLDSSIDMNKLVSYIDHVLLLHSGPIKSSRSPIVNLLLSAILIVGLFMHPGGQLKSLCWKSGKGNTIRYPHAYFLVKV